jgi:hypothetical protein
VPPGADEDHGEHEQESEEDCDGGDAELVVPAVVGDVGTCDE